ncbi:MAG TPA: exonuclease domain-containing protein [Mucilaginibacter sp.]|jgi:DNA polymerase-3 subunit epsilon|nr:exonuclease domain-containing protein [Mucilaginibacter sp.]
MKLNLKRPLAFFDLEATGTNIGTDRIVEISIIKLHPPNGSQEEVRTWRINPGMPIPLESSLVHGIYDEDVKKEPFFKEVATLVSRFIGNSDLAGYNSNKFDIPMLMEEFLRAGVPFDIENRNFVDVQNIFHQMEQRTLRAAYKFYCEKEIVNAHSAEADTRATMEVLLAQLAKYEKTPWEDKKGNVMYPVVNDVEALHQFTNLNRPVDFAGRMVFNEEGHEVFNFGKHKGKAVEEVFRIEPSYYSWMMQGDFPLYTKRKLEEIYNRWSAKKAAERAVKPVPPRPIEQAAPQKPVPPKPVEQKEKVQPVATEPQKNEQQSKPHQPKHAHNNSSGNKDFVRKPFKKRDEEPAKPVNEDMLKMLAEKFKKG